MIRLFESAKINGMSLDNRLVRSATWEGMSDQAGRPTQKLVDLYRDITLGGIGLLITGYAFVRPEGKALPYQMGIHTDDLEADYRKMVEEVHAAGGKIAIQLAHAGGQSASAVSGLRPLAPSAVKLELFPEIPAELSRDEINDIVKAFKDGARRAKAWGFDAVQLHAGHGYLFSQFLSPLTNRRTDEYGGSFENRCRFILEVYQAMREVVGPRYPIMAKMGICDNLEGGLEIEEGVRAARILAEAGLDAMEVSSGTMVSGVKNPCRQGINRPEKEAYHLDLALLVKKVVQCSVMVVGGFRSFEVAEKAVRDDGVDYVAMSRPLIKEPGLPKRWQQGDHIPASCISCNGCYQPGIDRGGICCVI